MNKPFHPLVAQSEAEKPTSCEQTNPDEAGDMQSSQNNLTKSLVTDVNGQPRQDTVRLPAAILGTRPGAVPNERASEARIVLVTKS